MNYLNQLEPTTLIDIFISHPPHDFKVWLENDLYPCFSLKFDLLTTIDISLQQKIKRFPLYRIWSKWLKHNACFLGTTVSEYALFSDRVKPIELIENFKNKHQKSYPFLIIKDIPVQSPLLSEAENRYATDLMTASCDQGFVLVEGQALAWVNLQFNSVTTYLDNLSSSRRKNIRRKLKSRNGLDVEVVKLGDNRFFTAHVIDEYYLLYLNVYQQSEIHFDLLTRGFFEKLLQNEKLEGVVFVYKRLSKIIAYNICFIRNGALIDKYIGLSYPEARQENIYTVSWFENMKYAQEQGLQRYVAGWTDPGVKAQLGAEFTLTKHAVYIRNPIARMVLRRLSSLFEADYQWFEQRQ
jgi:predicted N-acyltransferase